MIKIISRESYQILLDTISRLVKERREQQERIDRLVEAVARKDGGVIVRMPPPSATLPQFDVQPAPEKGVGWFDQVSNPLPPGGTKQ